MQNPEGFGGRRTPSGLERSVRVQHQPGERAQWRQWAWP